MTFRKTREVGRGWVILEEVGRLGEERIQEAGWSKEKLGRLGEVVWDGRLGEVK